MDMKKAQTTVNRRSGSRFFLFHFPVRAWEGINGRVPGAIYHHISYYIIDIHSTVGTITRVIGAMNPGPFILSSDE